jgi:hypothetical protein
MPPAISLFNKMNNKLFEELASRQHSIWANWQKYMHSRCIRNKNGSLTIPQNLVAHWERQIETCYENLTQKEKDSDREQVKRYWNLINK